MAQNEGKKFEEDWKNSFKKVNAYFFRIKDSAASFSGGNSSFTRSNPYDCFVLYEGYFFPMELKSTKGTSFSFEKEILENENFQIEKYGYKSEGYFIDIGIPEDYYKFQNYTFILK